MVEGAKMFPDLPRMRILRAYAGVRPLYKDDARGGRPRTDREISRAHAIIDHDARDGVGNFVSIVGGKLTTHRLMAEQTADVVAAKLGVTRPLHDRGRDAARTRSEGTRTGWATAWRSTRTRAAGTPTSCASARSCTRSMVDAFLDAHWPCSIDDVRRGTRLGMGPCQGAFCTFRVGRARRRAPRRAHGRDRTAGARRARGGRARTRDRRPACGDRGPCAHGFLRERFKGTRPIAEGRQLQELMMTNGIYVGRPGPRLDGLGPPTARRRTRRRVDAAR